MMPHMIAGVGGPIEQCTTRHPSASPAQSAAVRRQPAMDGDELDDGNGPDGAVLVPADEVLPDPAVAGVTTSDKYRELYGRLPLHRAVLDVYCRMAALGGRLMGDNMADTMRMSEQQMRALADEALDFITNRVDLLFGPAHTTKAHRVAAHLLAALLNDGNLWEGDTSENEALHGVCKKMYGRTNKRGPSMVLQMMRATETQTEVLRELRALVDMNKQEGDGVHDLLDEVADESDVQMEPVVTLPRSHRGRRLLVADAQSMPGMAGLGELLGEGPDGSLVVSPSVSFSCTFEWGARSVTQTACATELYQGRPRYDHIWYTDQGGQRRLGWVRMVVRMIGGAVDDCVIVRCMQEVPSISDCALTRSGCRRMAWSFPRPDAEWPELARVPLARILRLEHVVVDFQDLGDRRGLAAVPSNTPDTAVERRAARFFTNHFYPFTSRVLNPST